MAVMALVWGTHLPAQTVTTPELPAPAPAILGFSPSDTVQQRSWEKRFDTLLRRDNLREWMQRMSARPHHLGSAYGKENAEFIAALFRSWGYETEIEQFDVLFPTPKTRLLEMVAPEKFSARLTEPPLKEDATSGLTAEQLPTYTAYSIDGDVTGELVYVNYGVPRDYETLAERGVDTKGKIVIARYGGSWRGIKPKVAAEHGAIGCLIYSDPRDDGYFEGDVYPKGAFRNENGAQRGSVADIPYYPGDPLTPGVGATNNAPRFPIPEAPTLTKIPVLPISHADALPLLRALQNGPVAPEEWRGALPITYHLGPGPATVHLQLAFDWKMVPAYDIIATLRGEERPDEWVIRGNHHDAWVFGADDPLSGLVPLLEEARAISELKKSGWKSKRTLVFAAWDGEEPGLLGSTEWVETHADTLKNRAVAYINGDNNGRGFLQMSGSHTLERFINEVAREVIDPQKKITVAERLKAYRLVKGTPEEKREARERADLRIGAMGSGSDYTPFLQHLGIASLDLRYGGEDHGGSYHSIYDSFDHYVKFGDPDFAYGIALAQTAGRVLLRLANADLLPWDFSNFSETLARYVKELESLTEDMRGKTQEKNRLLQDKAFAAVYDPTLPYVLPKAEAPVPYLNFAPLDNAMARLQESARRYQAAMKPIREGKSSLPLEQRKALDLILMKTERAMTSEAGLPQRPWYKHQIYAPGFYTGYRAKTLSGVREAIEERQWFEADHQIELAAQMIKRVAAEIDRATVLVNGRAKP